MAAGAQHHPPATLYVVATPIGNLADLTLRAVHVLAQVDTVACEDTRTSGALLRHLGLDKALLAVHAHNESHAAQRVIALLQAGQRVAFVSDAGTPAISDPGAALVAAVAASGHRVVPVPGPSSAVAAMSVAGDAHGSGFRFVGFLPAKGAQRREALLSRLRDETPQVLFEAPHRIESLARDLAETAPNRTVTLCRELTKQFETVATMPAAALPGWLAVEATRLRGEFVLVLHGTAPPSALDADALPAPLTETLALLVQALPLKQAVGLATAVSGAPRNAVYAAALALRQARDGVEQHDALDGTSSGDRPD